MRKLLTTTCVHLGKALYPLKVTCFASGGRQKYTAVHACPLHRRCLPHFQGPLPEAMRDVEGRQFTLCERHDGTRCEDFSK